CPSVAAPDAAVPVPQQRQDGPGGVQADACAGRYAARSILAPLRGRDRGSRRGDGAARAIASRCDTTPEPMGGALTHARHTGVDQEPVGMGSPAVAPYGAYRTADGQTVVLGTTNDQEWQRLARDVLGRRDLADDPQLRTNAGRVAARRRLDAEI